MSNLLPIGSIVKIKTNSKVKIMILGYFLIEQRQKKCYQYAGVIYPVGIPETNNFFLFNHRDINEIFFYGYATSTSIAQLDNWVNKVEQT